MRHRIKKIKIKKGKDSNRALMRKLLNNFIYYGTVTTTLARAKVLKSLVDRIVYKAVRSSNADKNEIKKAISSKKIEKKLIEIIVVNLKKRTGGFCTLKRIGYRKGDGSEMATVTWTDQLDNVYKKTKKTSKKEKKEKTVQKTAVKTNPDTKVEKK